MQIVYTCPKCGNDLRCVMLTSNPPKTVWECWNCGWSAGEQTVDVVRMPYPNVEESEDNT